MKTPTLAIFALLSLLAGTAQAECLPGAPARQPVAAEVSKLEAALRGGQITPYEAGRQMRQQWEIAQFQRGFLEGGQAVHPGEGCGSTLNINLAPIGDRAGSMAGNMAKNGMQTASTLMRALMRETQRLIKENQAREAAKEVEAVEDPAP